MGFCDDISGLTDGSAGSVADGELTGSEKSVGEGIKLFIIIVGIITGTTGTLRGVGTLDFR